MTLRTDLINAFKAATDKPLVYVDSQNVPVRSLSRVQSDDDEKTFPVFIRWGGRERVGVGSRLRTIWQVYVVISPMDTDDPYADVDTAVDAALEVIAPIPTAYPYLYPIVSDVIAPQGSRGKSFAVAIIRVVGA